MINQIAKILEDRIRKDDGLFYLDLKVESKIGDSFIICSKKIYYGLYIDKDDAILRCVYDKIEPLYNDLCLLKVCDKWGIYDIKNRRLIVDYVIDSFIVHEDFGTIEICRNGLIGLFSIENKVILIPMEYEDVTYYENCEYLWVQRDNVYGFVKKDTQEVIMLNDVVVGYDMKEGMFAKCRDGNVCAFTDDGYIDYMKFRHYILQNKGRGRFVNYKYHIIDITDIYGYILD